MKDITLFAQTTIRNQQRSFGIKTDDRRRHMYLIGKTGMGKSTVLENMIIDDIRAGRGVAVVDPHGDLAEKIIEFVPSERLNDIIYFNPSDIDYPIAFNVVEQVEPHLRHLVASGLIGVFEKLWADSWGPRLEYILRNSILAILDYPNSTLLSITRMLSDKAFRKKVIEKIQDPVVKAFWTKEFASYADKFASEAVSPIQNKVGQFLSSSLIRNVVGQVKSSIDLRAVMDEGKILIMNLSKGRIGEDNSELLGAMMITKIQLAAMSRVNIPEEERRDFYLYVDEFQNFATDSFANILSEARKYRLNLIMGHQYIEQLSDNVRAAVFGNVGTLVVFRVGATDAEELVKEFLPIFTQEDLVNLPKYQMCLKLMIDGIASDPFSARGLPPLGEDEKTFNKDQVTASSRERYAAERSIVEDKILRWHAESDEPRPTVVHASPAPPRREAFAAPPGQFAPPPRREPVSSAPAARLVPALPYAASPAPVPAPVAPDPVEAEPLLDTSIYKYSVHCSRCSTVTRVSFQPDGIRPVYCKNCLNILRQEKLQLAEERKKLKQEEIDRVFSLRDLSTRAPLDFKGRELTSHPAPPPLPSSPTRLTPAPVSTPHPAEESAGPSRDVASHQGRLRQDEPIVFH